MKQMTANKPKQLTIASRLRRSLPVDQCRILRFRVVNETGVGMRTYYRTINEDALNVHILISLAKFLKCTIDDVLNPEFIFRDPQLVDPSDLATQLGSFKDEAA